MGLLKQESFFTVELGKSAIDIKLNEVNFNYSVKFYFKTLDGYVRMNYVNPVILKPDKVLTILDPGEYKIEIYSAY